MGMKQLHCDVNLDVARTITNKQTTCSGPEWVTVSTRSRVVELPWPKKLKEHGTNTRIPQTAEGKPAWADRFWDICKYQFTLRNVNNYDYNNNNNGEGKGRVEEERVAALKEPCPTPWDLLVQFPFNILLCSLGILISISIRVQRE